jgi:hypothetical protein
VQGALGHGALGGGSHKHHGKGGGTGSHLHGWVEG